MDSKRIRNVDISQIHHLPMIDFIGNDFAIFNDIKDMPLNSYPTRLNAACLTVCVKGWCKLELNLQQCEMQEGMLGIILPDQIILQKERSDDFSGLFIAVSRDFRDYCWLCSMRYTTFIRDMPFRNAFPKAGRKTCSSVLSVLSQSPTKKSVACPIMPTRCSSQPSTYPQ